MHVESTHRQPRRESGGASPYSGLRACARLSSFSNNGAFTLDTQVDLFTRHSQDQAPASASGSPSLSANGLGCRCVKLADVVLHASAACPPSSIRSVKNILLVAVVAYVN